MAQSSTLVSVHPLDATKKRRKFEQIASITSSTALLFQMSMIRLPFFVGHTGSVLTSVCGRSIEERGVLLVYRVRRTQAEFKEGIFKCIFFRSRTGLDILLALAVRSLDAVTQCVYFRFTRKPATLEGFHGKLDEQSSYLHGHLLIFAF